MVIGEVSGEMHRVTNVQDQSPVVPRLTGVLSYGGILPSPALLFLTHTHTQPKTETDGELSRSEEHTSEIQSLEQTSYAVFFLKKKTQQHTHTQSHLTDYTAQDNRHRAGRVTTTSS